MPRQARLDAPGTLHHVIIRGIEKRPIVDDDEDRNLFIERLGTLSQAIQTPIYAWVLMTNHAHFLIRSGLAGLASFMRKFLTGYAIRYNRRHHRLGRFPREFLAILFSPECVFGRKYMQKENLPQARRDSWVLL